MKITTGNATQVLKIIIIYAQTDIDLLRTSTFYNYERNL